MTAVVLGVLACGASAAIAPVARAAQVKGIVETRRVDAPRGLVLGYTRTRVSAPAASTAQRKADVALLLAVKTSLPIAPAAEPSKVSISGLRFSPSVAACVVDSKVALTNDDKSPVTVLVDQKDFQQIAPGETKTYDCTAPGLKKLRVKEWPHMRASIYVGEIGVAGSPNATGAFSLQAPQGKYELMVIGEDGPLVKREVEIARGDVDVGRITTESDAAAAPAPGAGDPKPAPDPAIPGNPGGAANPANPGGAANPANPVQPKTDPTKADPAKPAPAAPAKAPAKQPPPRPPKPPVEEPAEEEQTE